MNAASRASEAFVSEYGFPPSSLWSAPGRVNLIGEHTDYNDGLVFPLALPHRTAVAASPRMDRKLSMSTLDETGKLHRAPVLALEHLSPAQNLGWAQYPAGVAWALQEEGITFPGADLVIVGEVPAGAGLSSSHALECAVALTLLDIVERAVDGPHAPGLPEIALWVQRAENEFVGAPTGLLDQTASLACTDAHALFFDIRTGQTEQVPFDLSKASLDLLVIDTRASHSHSESGYGNRRRGCERAAELLQVKALRDLESADLAESLSKLPEELRPLVRHVVTENERVLTTVSVLRAGRPHDVGPLLTSSHASMRDDYRISCRELDLAVDSALEAGALGARMTGGGFGGSVIALIRSEQHEQIERRVLDAFSQQKLTLPRLFTVIPADGARRER